MFKGKPVIGITPLYDEQKESYWMLPGYMKALEEQGAVVMMLPLTEHEEELDYFLESCDGFLLTGGQDVSPELYGEEKLPECGETCRLRDQMDQYLLRQAAARDLAVLGICRGIQLMNAAYGGTLYQDLPSQKPSPVEHHMTPPYDRAVHTVQIIEGTPLANVLTAGECPVNSYHHQAVKAIAPAFREMAKSSDGLTEAVYMPGKRFVWGIQWHPELSYQSSEASRRILAAFLRAAGAHD